MDAASELRWVVSLSASACHLGDLARRGLGTEHPLVQAAVGPAQVLDKELRGTRLEEGVFWAHLLPLSAQVENNRQLIEAVVRRMLPPPQRATFNPVRLAGCVADLEAAVARAQPGLVEELTPAAERARAEWDERGPGLLRRIGELTNPGLVPQAATVAPIWPALGGYASAHLAWNLVRIELGETNPAGLSDVLCLAWLMSQLNLELPMFSETITPDRLPRLAAWAMLPPALQAAEEVGLTPEPGFSLRAALEAWHVEAPDLALVVEKLDVWWQSYLDARPDWDVAIAALERMIEG